MSRQKIFQFLRDLQVNNNKEWMDANRHRYQEAKDIWLADIQKILNLLGKYDAYIPEQNKPKDTISRINNNRRFQPDKPVYKDNFTFTIMDKSDDFCPIHISIGATHSFMGCGYPMPEKDTLQNIREGIDYEGKVLHDILNDAEFKIHFSGLSDYGGTLKTAPKGFDKEHPYIELLRYRSYVIERKLTDDEVVSDGFFEMIEKAYVASKPFQAFLKKTTSI